MSGSLTVLRRELTGYFATPVAYVFLAIFLGLAGYWTWFLGGFYDSNQADLRIFFAGMPWVLLVLVPALSMRLWSEERSQGTIELLLTLPITTGAAVVGKFLAAWCFVAVGLALTTPVWGAVAYLGDPDHGVIVASYAGLVLLAGAYLAIGGLVSALTRNQVIAFVVTFLVLVLNLLAGDEGLVDLVTFLPRGWVTFLRDASLRHHFADLSRGVVGVVEVAFYLSTIALALFAGTLAVDARKAR